MPPHSVALWFWPISSLASSFLRLVSWLSNLSELLHHSARLISVEDRIKKEGKCDVRFPSVTQDA